MFNLKQSGLRSFQCKILRCWYTRQDVTSFPLGWLLPWWGFGATLQRWICWRMTHRQGKVAIGWVINGKLVGNSGDGSQLLMSLVHLRELWTWMTTAQQILAFQLNCHPSTLVHPKTTGTLPLSLRSILNSKSSHPTKSQQATAFGPAAIGTQIGGYVPPKAGW